MIGSYFESRYAINCPLAYPFPIFVILILTLSSVLVPPTKVINPFIRVTPESPFLLISRIFTSYSSPILTGY